MTNLHVLSRQEMSKVNGGGYWRQVLQIAREVMNAYIVAYGPDHTSRPGDADRARRNETLMNCI